VAAVFNKAGYVFQDACEISQHIVIPVAQDDDAVFVEPLRTVRVCGLSTQRVVLTSVNLDREFYGWAVEVEDVTTDCMLTPELQIVDLPAAQCFPKFGLSIRHISA
jgi:hypothetical protein